MPRKFNPERAAAALVDAAFTDDKAAARKHGISVRSIENWRSRLNHDAELVELFAHKKALVTKGWAARLDEAIETGIDFLIRASAQANPMAPDAIHAVAGAVKLLSEIRLTEKVLDARLAGSNRPNAPEVGAVAAAHRGARR